MVRRALWTTGIAGVATLALAGCQWTSPVTTEMSYDPADGVSGQVGDLQLHNVLVISDAKGGPGNVVGLASNSGAQPLQISVSTLEAGQSGGPGGQVLVPANSAAQLTPSSAKALTVPSIGVPPGANVQLLVRTGAGQTVLDVPVLPGEGFYKTFAPESAPSAPAKGAQPTATAQPPTATATP